MELNELKPLASALVLPPAGPLLLALAGWLLARRHRRTGALLGIASLATLWLLACNAVAVALAGGLLPQVAPLARQQLDSVQAVVVLGGGVLPQAAEYGAAQPAQATLTRLRYGVRLARESGKPLAFAGGIGWGAAGTPTATEAQVVARVAREEYGITPRWLDDRSRDTRENALRMAELMRADKVRRIALVTDAWHMPRALRAFQQAGFEDVVPAPTGFAGPRERDALEWLPSAHGLTLSRQVLREWLALRLAP